MASKTVKVDLKEPVEVDGKVYSFVTIGKFKVKHFKYMPDEFYEMIDKNPKKISQAQQAKLGVKMIPLLAAMCNVTEDVFDEFDPDDIEGIMDAVGPFLEASLSSTSGKK